MRKLVKTLRYKAGYEVRTYVVSGKEAGGDKPFNSRRAFTPEGHYIGSPAAARNLIVRRGLKLELARPTDEICSVGFNEVEKKWYGYSHRAICGFGIGDMIFEERFGNDRTPFVRHGKRPIKNMKDARLAAVRFAGSVS